MYIEECYGKTLLSASETQDLEPSSVKIASDPRAESRTTVEKRESAAATALASRAAYNLLKLPLTNPRVCRAAEHANQTVMPA